MTAKPVPPATKKPFENHHGWTGSWTSQNFCLFLITGGYKDVFSY